MDILNSGLRFDQDEAPLKFKIRLLNSCLLVAIVGAFLVGLLHDLGLHNTGDTHAYVNYALSFLSLGLLFWLRQSKENFHKVSYSLVILCLITFTSALIFVTEDQFRIIWFYIVVFIAYTIIGNQAGIITSLLAILIVVSSAFIFDLGLSQTTLQGALIGLIISSLLASIHVRKISEFETVLLKKNKELEVLATIDGLTGVMNKRMFNEMASKYIDTARRTSKPLTFLYLDLDHFKSVNDNHGHQVGDIMLMKFTAIVGKNLRKSDLLGRIGGEEFAVILFETDREAGMLVAEKIRQHIQETSYQYEDKLVEVTTSIGLSQLESKIDTLEAIQQRADKALYKAKESGRNRVVTG